MPTTRKLSMPLIIANLAVIAYLLIIGHVNTLLTYILYLAISAILIYIIFYDSILLKNRVKRLLGLYLYLILPIIVISMLLYVLKTNAIHLVIIVPAILSYFLYRSIHYPLKPYKPLSYIIMTFLLTVFISTILYKEGIPLYLYVATILLIIIIELYLYRINSLGKPVFNALTLFYAFAKLWLSDDPTPLEREFNKIAERRSGWVKVLRVLDKDSEKVNLVLVVPSFHGGPFRNLGGSSLVKEINSMLRTKFNAESLILHAPCGHSWDPVSHEDVKKIVNTLYERLTKDPNGVNVDYFNIENYSLKYYDVDILYSRQVPMIIISGKSGYGIDDLPPDVHDYLRKCLQQEANVKDIIVVEGHNWIAKGKEANRECVISTLELIKHKIMGRIKQLNRLRVERLGYGLDKSLVQNPDICELGISALIIEFDTEKVFSLIVIDGNNMKGGVRHLINKFVKECLHKYYTNREVIVETVTTDNHSKTGVETGIERGYRAVGEYTNINELLESVKKALNRALANMFKPVMEYHEIIVNDVNVLGYENYNFLLKTLDRAVKYVSKTLLPLHILIYIVPIMLAIL